MTSRHTSHKTLSHEANLLGNHKKRSINYKGQKHLTARNANGERGKSLEEVGILWHLIYSFSLVVPVSGVCEVASIRKLYQRNGDLVLIV